MRLGVFGGTFDPVHYGHLVVAETAADELALDRVLFIPAGDPYLKANRRVSAARDRMEMVRMAVEGNPRFEASDMELRRAGPSYTIDTLAQLRGERGAGARLFLILGLDSIADMHRWKDPERIFEQARVVGYPRAGERGARGTAPTAGGREAHVLEGPLVGISGTEIRRRVSRGQSIRYQAPECVIEYIRRRGLYR